MANVAAWGRSLAAARDILPTYRAHNEQADGACSLGLRQDDEPSGA
jgi:TPP-dependent trihydroxycyclohexane-1,2-dione (THcHDO) dehydratase